MNNYEEMCVLIHKLLVMFSQYPELDIPLDADDILDRLEDLANDKYPRFNTSTVKSPFPDGEFC